MNSEPINIKISNVDQKKKKVSKKEQEVPPEFFAPDDFEFDIAKNLPDFSSIL